MPVGGLLTTNDSGSVAQAAGSIWRLEALTRRPQPLKAKVAQSGHSRMTGAIDGNGGSRGGVIMNEGTPEQKAAALIAYLRENRLVDF